MRVEDSTMRLIRPLIDAVIVVGDPRPQRGQHGTLMLGQELLERLMYRLRRTLDRDLIRLPHNGVEIEMSRVLPVRQRTSVRALARARVAEDENSHHSG